MPPPDAPRWARTATGHLWHQVAADGYTALCGRRVVWRSADATGLATDPPQAAPRCGSCAAAWQRQQQQTRRARHAAP